jgi:hypothetical protein
VLRLHDRIRAAIERASTAADEAERERRVHASDAPDPVPLVRNLRRLSHDLVMIGRALHQELPGAVAARLAPPAAVCAAAVAQALDAIGSALADATPSLCLDEAKQGLGGFAAEIAALRRDGATRALPEEAVERVYGLAFAIDQLGQHLDELAVRVRELGSQ